MKYNKGFAPLVIVAIVVGFLAVGSGAYLLGKNQNEKVKIVNEEQEENKLVSDCLPDSDPWVKVISPNGGEIFTIGQDMEVKWKTCNTKEDQMISLMISQVDTIVHEVITYDPFPSSVINDGIEIIKLKPDMSISIPSSNNRISIILKPSPNNEKETPFVQDVSDGTFTINSDSEESISEVFNNKPGAIKSVRSDGSNKWIIEVDLLSNNNNWVPGVNLPFVNQNTKIRDLTVNFDTKIYECNEGAKPTILVNNSNFINKLQNRISQAKNEFKNRVGGVEDIMDWVTAYFDINGNNITAIYEQCLP